MFFQLVLGMRSTIFGISSAAKSVGEQVLVVQSTEKRLEGNWLLETPRTSKLDKSIGSVLNPMMMIRKME